MKLTLPLKKASKANFEKEARKIRARRRRKTPRNAHWRPTQEEHLGSYSDIDIQVEEVIATVPDLSLVQWETVVTWSPWKRLFGQQYFRVKTETIEVGSVPTPTPSKPTLAELEAILLSTK